MREKSFKYVDADFVVDSIRGNRHFYASRKTKTFSCLAVSALWCCTRRERTSLGAAIVKKMPARVRMENGKQRYQRHQHAC